MKNTQQIQGIVSIAALACLAIGWFKLLSPEVNDILYHQVFYALIGISFYLQAPTLANPKFVYPMYGAAALCVIGAVLPVNLGLTFIKTIGLFAGVIISLIGRPKAIKKD
ncbi:hypothetical protein [Frigoriflavimonas asaccharolytica]|uniref:Uncharacterized protein n=1 Tax=Frigoriflavimonas asaccharolytica TaxID=2735899 RepID=A0A8J8G676_9FLAO|nr:hypothetical protein [Frigoriflavimonas asaccharolytica]NRS92248.1 hypothetical protein [Frigoriflavimonas asaccharolytica]